MQDRKTRSLQTCLRSRDLLFVPYTRSMIPKYCSWFADEHLRKMTSTEGLTESEFEHSHKIWTSDSNKIMFIVLSRLDYEQSQDQLFSMIGDVNMVISQDETPDSAVAEVMLMIGDARFRGKGLGRQMLLVLMRYAEEEFFIRKFEAHISLENHSSIALFTSLGFTTVSTDETFGEHLLQLQLDEPALQALVTQSDNVSYSIDRTSSHQMA
ncbi:putative N-acetyltransferase 9-like protein [Hypsibius exemplaris]|uniref:N-acetyltransferase 9-like protein n=1 Tax=Hypsibius exemplaris TaxID=2072580 RepID=A0A1W0WAJ8_HYPEX|nr:putative N-acetyltransferase 9-like protein [Hypsibius exemplaris]